jgi:hypothetical protein
MKIRRLDIAEQREPATAVLRPERGEAQRYPHLVGIVHDDQENPAMGWVKLAIGARR